MHYLSRCILRLYIFRFIYPVSAFAMRLSSRFRISAIDAHDCQPNSHTNSTMRFYFSFLCCSFHPKINEKENETMLSMDLFHPAKGILHTAYFPCAICIYVFNTISMCNVCIRLVHSSICCLCLVRSLDFNRIR